MTSPNSKVLRSYGFPSIADLPHFYPILEEKNGGVQHLIFNIYALSLFYRVNRIQECLDQQEIQGDYITLFK